MKKIVALFTICVCLYASLSNAKSKLIKTLSELIFNDKTPTIYIQSPEYNSIKNIDKNIIITSDCQKADFLIISSYKNVSKKCFEKNPIVFVTKYSSFKNNTDSLGTIFWQKGRLNIIFRKEKLHDLHVSLPKQYDKYIE